MTAADTALIERDSAARAEALDTTRSFIVQAPAGSGKTALLTQRVLALLARVEAPEQIVAMTFTRKAAAEMRRRILGELQDTRQPEDCAAEHDRRTRALAMAARARDQQMGWNLATASNRLRITTIDGFCGGLVRRAPWLSGAGGMPNLVDDARPYHQMAARRTIAQRDRDDGLGAAVRRLLDHVDGNASRLAEMLAALIGRRDAWRGLLSTDTAAMRATLEANLRVLCTDALERASQVLSDNQRDRWWASAQTAARHLPDDRALQEAVAVGHLPQRAEECGHWPALCALLMTKEGKLRKSVNKSIGFPTTVREAKAEHEALLQALAATPGAEVALHHLAMLVAPVYDARQWRTLEDLLAVFRHALAELSLCFSEKGAADH
ncbi:MAG: UvrD-helicase domain-containing protein, partial [Algiphilus sp.]